MEKLCFIQAFLPIARDETGVAAIMGHEVAHALANHGQQRMSAGMIQQGVASGRCSIATKDKSEFRTGNLDASIWRRFICRRNVAI